MKQRTLAMMTGFEEYTRKTGRAIFLEEMEQVVPWRELCGLIEPHYPKPGNGRPPVGVERMLRIYFLQQWFNLSDPAVEETLYDSAVMRQFVGIDLGHEPVPDETTACKFRHLLEEHQLGEQILGTVNLHLQAQGVRITTGTIVDATILHAPSSTKNREQQRDPEMHQTKKGNQWYFGMNAHVGVDSKTKIIHTAVATAANVADSAMLPDLLHGEETRVWGDQAYRGQTDVIWERAPQADDRRKPNPSACTGLAEHLLPRRHGLIQSFPRSFATLNEERLMATPSQTPDKSNRAVVAFADGRRLRGYIFDFSAIKDSFRLSPEEDPLQKKGAEVKMKDLKAVFFVRDFNGNRGYQESQAVEGQRHGRRLEVIFRDGEKLVGTSEAYNPQKLGFFLFPADGKSNNSRIFIVNKNVQKVKFL